MRPRTVRVGRKLLREVGLRQSRQPRRAGKAALAAGTVAIRTLAHRHGMRSSLGRQQQDRDQAGLQDFKGTARILGRRTRRAQNLRSPGRRFHPWTPRKSGKDGSPWLAPAMRNDIAPRAQSTARVHEELVPLPQACAAAYHILIEAQGIAACIEEIEESRGLIAIALSRVATFYRMRDGAFSPLSQSEVQATLFSGAQRQGLDGLYIRRGTLVRALETLKAVSFL